MAQFHKMHNAKVPSSAAERDDDAPAEMPQTRRPTDGENGKVLFLFVLPKAGVLARATAMMLRSHWQTDGIDRKDYFRSNAKISIQIRAFWSHCRSD